MKCSNALSPSCIYLHFYLHISSDNNYQDFPVNIWFCSEMEGGRERGKKKIERGRDLLANGHECLHFMTPHTHNQLHFRSNPNSHSVQLCPLCSNMLHTPYTTIQCLADYKGRGLQPCQHSMAQQYATTQQAVPYQADSGYDIKGSTGPMYCGGD